MKKKIVMGILAGLAALSLSASAFAAPRGNCGYRGNNRRASFVDVNKDGVCDNRGACGRFSDKNGDGVCDNCKFTDADGYGVCDNYANRKILNQRVSVGAGQGRGCGGGKGRNCRR